MWDILTDLQSWLEEGRSIALATVIQTWGSSPRGPGSKMAFTPDGKISGSVSGGCVENAVFEAGLDSLENNFPRLLHFGVADETAWDIGLACGGSIDVFVKPLERKFFQSLRSVLEDDRKAVLITVIRGPGGVLGHELLVCEDGEVIGSIRKDGDREIIQLGRNILSYGKSRRLQLYKEVEVFAEVILPSPKLIIVGGAHISITLSTLAKMLGYRTVVIDPRRIWSSAERFPHVDQLIQAWPEEAFQQVQVTPSTAIAMLTHDPKLDDSALKIALNSQAFYVGALGSRTTQAKRRERLLDEGLTESQLDRLHGPIGLGIHAETPEEIALAIMAEVVEAHRIQRQQPAEIDADVPPAAEAYEAHL